MLAFVNQPIYEEATKSKLLVAIRLLAARTNWHAPEKCLEYFIQMLVDVAPKNNYIPKNYYEAKKLASKLGLKAEKIDCCMDGCMLYYKEDKDLTECKFCHSPRYLPPKVGKVRYKNIPVKRMFYLPIIPRLQRLYASMETVRQMGWHHKNKNNSTDLRHPCDGEAWKHFDHVYPDFASEPRNIRLGLCSNGFTPYVQASTNSYSCWPVIVTPYNLPLEMCMTKPYFFLTCLILGPHNPTTIVDVYLQPLIDDLKLLWDCGVLTYDISTEQNFILRAGLMWTINDFPAYGMLSGWGIKGKLACLHCMKDTKAFQLDNGVKPSWFDCHQRLLPADHPFRKSKRRFTRNKTKFDRPRYFLKGDQIWKFIHNFPKATNGSLSNMPGYGQLHHWFKRSIF
uniref:DUF4218 domain-containing protein n=2 Tax=Cajanus cajan TaxID=3821 RepID=A0A151S514_CAJCA|nr:hypothetical protein KK1_028347 [Cajanus cajan]